MNPHNSQLFPLNSLPVEIQNTVWTVERAVQSPVPLIAASTLSAMAIACQGLVDVQMPTGQVAPTSLFFITTAESGERKSATDRMLTQSISQLQSKWAAAAVDLEKDFANAMELWRVEHSAIEAKLRRAIKRNQPCDDLRAVFLEHARYKPLPAQNPRVIYSDTTIEAMLQNMHVTWPYAALVSSEGSGVLSGHAMRQIGVLNSLWDGSEGIRVDRKTEASFTLQNARLSMSIMVQRKPFEQFLSRNHGEAWETGLLSRTLVAEPLSRQGSRIDYGPQVQGEGTDLEWFHARVGELIQQTVAARNAQRPRELLSFTPEAATEWRQFANQIEGQLTPGGYFDDVRGFASKLTNNMSRLAAVMHYFCGRPGPIDLDTTRSAIALATWYATEFKQLFGAVEGFAIREDLGRLLVDWLWRRFKRNGLIDCPIDEIYHYGPSKVRKRAALEIAIQDPQAKNLIQVFWQSKPAFVRLVAPTQLPIGTTPYAVAL